VPLIKPLITQNQLTQRVEQLAADIAQAEHDRGASAQESPLLMVALMRGSFIFAADLARALHRNNVALECEFMGLSSYGDDVESSGKVRLTQDIQVGVAARRVLLIDDILESGLSLDFARKMLLGRDAAQVSIAVLLEKAGKRRTPLDADFVGFQVEDHFVVGYGLDAAGRYRELPYIGVVEG